MLDPFILLIIGLVLILVEFFVPGAIMGTIGVLVLIASFIVFALESSSLLATVAFFCFIVASSIFLVWFALWRIRHSKKGLYSNEDQEGFTASHYDAKMIGKEGVVVSDLKPGGYIQIEGNQYQAISESGYLVRGEKVRVIGGEAESLTVLKEK